MTFPSLSFPSISYPFLSCLQARTRAHIDTSIMTTPHWHQHICMPLRLVSMRCWLKALTEHFGQRKLTFSMPPSIHPAMPGPYMDGQTFLGKRFWYKLQNLADFQDTAIAILIESCHCWQMEQSKQQGTVTYFLAFSIEDTQHYNYRHGLVEIYFHFTQFA